MQQNVDHIITKLKEHIKTTNSSNNLATPFFHMDITKRHSKEGGITERYTWTTYTMAWSHATQNTKQKWANTLKSAIDRIRGNNKRKAPFSPTHTNSPKRPGKKMKESPTPHHKYIPHVVHDREREWLSKVNIDLHVCIIVNRSYIYIYMILLNKLCTTPPSCLSWTIGAPVVWGIYMNAYILLSSLAAGALLLRKRR